MKKITKKNVWTTVIKYAKAKSGTFGSGVRQRVGKMGNQRGKKVYVNTGETIFSSQKTLYPKSI